VSHAFSKAKPHKSLLRPQKHRAGRNSFGRITVRHRGGGAKQQYRVIEFGQRFVGLSGIVQTIEYDPNRTTHIALVLFPNGARSYILAPDGLKEGDTIEINETAPVGAGNRMRLVNIPVGSFVHNIEMQPGGGGRLARSAGSAASVMAHDGKFTHLKMPSGEIRKVLSQAFASLGQLSNPEHRLANVGKAGRMRLRGFRPTVRGKVMNPRDHPYGGGEGKTTRGTKRPKDKWGNITGGHKTRPRRKWSQVFIVSRRPPGAHGLKK
jgi:large subunit ribosomal protein L2